MRVQFEEKLEDISLTAAIAMAPASARGQWRTPWSYEGARGPGQGGSLIRNARKVNLPAIRFEYKSCPLKYPINNGHTIRVNYHAPASGGILIVGEKRYQLMHEAGDGKVAGSRFFYRRASRTSRLRAFGNICRIPRVGRRKFPESR
jgi:hypothetical protein